jgi:hypothetical protein
VREPKSKPCYYDGQSCISIAQKHKAGPITPEVAAGYRQILIHHMVDYFDSRNRARSKYRGKKVDLLCDIGMCSDVARLISKYDEGTQSRRIFFDEWTREQQDTKQAQVVEELKKICM